MSSVQENQSLPEESGVPHAVFSLEGVAGHERYDVWQDSISCIFEVDSHKDIRDEQFNASVDANMFGPVMLARTQTLRQEWKRTPGIMARDGMDHYMIQLYESGNMLWDTDKGEFAFPEQGLVVFDLAQEVNLKTDDFANISLIVPREMLEDQLKAADDHHLRVLGGAEPMVQLLRDHMISLKRLSAQMSAKQALEVAPATVGLAAACLNGAALDSPDQISGVAMAQVTKIRRFIEGNLTNPSLSANWIAGQVGVSRSRLYALFEPFGGVANYIRERRLRKALLELAQPNIVRRTIYDIALSAGYTSDTAFSRAFRERYGSSPNEVRNGAVVSTPEHTVSDGLDRRYETWLNRLSV